MHNDNMEQAPISSDSERKRGQFFLSLRMMYLLGSLGTFSLGLLLIYNPWLPLVPLAVCLPFAASTTSFLFGVMEASSVQNKLDAVFNSTGQKLAFQLTGAVACFALTAGFTYWALDRDLRQKEIELGINKTTNDSTYIYLVPKSLVNKGDLKMDVGKLNVKDEFEKIQSSNVLNPVLVKIRDDCHIKQGLCAISDNIFPVMINDGMGLKPNVTNSVLVCHGHRYLIGMTLKLALNKKELIRPLPEGKPVDTNKIYKVKVEEQYEDNGRCPPSNLKPPTPMLLIGEPSNRISINNFNQYFAIDSGD